MHQFFDNIKAWVNYSWSIFLARAEVLAAILFGAIEGLDWNALTSLNFSDSVASKNSLIIAALWIIKGIMGEVGRRAGTVTATNNQLVPVNLAKKAKIEIK